MLNTTILFELYKQEKRDMEMPSDPFPSFKLWKIDYVEDWKKNHEWTAEDEKAEKLLAEADIARELLRQQSPEIKPKKKKKKTTVTTTVKTQQAPSKKERAVKVYQSMMDGDTHPQRKAVIEAFMTNVSMSQAGASTYHYNIKKMFS